MVLLDILRLVLRHRTNNQYKRNATTKILKRHKPTSPEATVTRQSDTDLFPHTRVCVTGQTAGCRACLWRTRRQMLRGCCPGAYTKKPMHWPLGLWVQRPSDCRGTPANSNPLPNPPGFPANANITIAQWNQATEPILEHSSNLCAPTSNDAQQPSM